MRAYVADLAAYNEGKLVGEWLDLEGLDADDIKTAIGELLVKWTLAGSSTPLEVREEYAIHDWEGDGLSAFGEQPDWEAVVQHVSMVSEHGDAWIAYCSWQDTDYQSAGNFAESYRGSADSEKAWVEQDLIDSGQLTEDFKYWAYVDFERLWEGEYDCDGWHSVNVSGTVYIFQPT